jgi:hypothetical protein
MGVENEAAPSEAGPRLLEVDAHYELESIAIALAKLSQTRSVIEGELRVMNAAGADDREHAIVSTGDNILDGTPALNDGLDAFRAYGELSLELER